MEYCRFTTAQQFEFLLDLNKQKFYFSNETILEVDQALSFRAYLTIEVRRSQEL